MMATKAVTTNLRCLIDLVKSRASVKFVEAIELGVTVKPDKCPRPCRCSVVLLGSNANWPNTSSVGDMVTQHTEEYQPHAGRRINRAVTKGHPTNPEQRLQDQPVPWTQPTPGLPLQDLRFTSTTTKNQTPMALSQRPPKDLTEAAQPTGDKRVQFTLSGHQAVTVVVGKITTPTDIILANILNVLRQVAKAKPQTTKLKAMVGRIHLRSTMGQSVDITDQTLASQ